MKKNLIDRKTIVVSSVISDAGLANENTREVINVLKASLFALFWWVFSTSAAHAQYEDNPLRNRRWYSVSGGLNTSDYWSWQGMFSYSKRGEGSLIQTRLAFTQELWMAPNDSCTEKHNKLSELGVLWGDGWAGKRWYVTGSMGFGFNVRQYCRSAGYNYEYITGLTLGVPFQVEAGLLLGKKAGLSIIGIANWNFREPYAGAHLAYIRFLGK